MRFVVVSHGNLGVPCIVVSEHVVPLEEIWAGVAGTATPLRWPAAYSVLHDKVAQFTEAADDYASRNATALSRLDASLLRAPAVAPKKILCVGLNYTDHVEEVGLPTPARPHVFSKLNTALNSPFGDIDVPWGVASNIDYEAELALVVGRRCKDVTVDDALNSVFGFTVANDVTARDWQFADDNQLTLGKGFDGFLPLGPIVATGDEIGDVNDLAIRCWVDGDLRQAASTGDMVASPAEIVAFLSTVCTLEPGDVIATGTPAGVGFGSRPQRFLRSGQVVEVEIDRIGRLRNRIV